MTHHDPRQGRDCGKVEYLLCFDCAWSITAMAIGDYVELEMVLELG